MKHRRHLSSWLVLLVAVALLVAACGSDDGESTTTAAAGGDTTTTTTTAASGDDSATTTAAAEETTTTLAAEPVSVSLRLPWFPSAQFAGSYVAAAKGYFADEGLDVTINAGGFDINSITLVAAGSDTFGLHDTNSLVFAAAEEIPLITVATYLQKHPGAIMALESSGYETLDDLVGATIGFQEGGPWQLTQAMLVKNGLEPDSLKQVAVGFDLTPLFEGDIDLMTVFSTNEPILAEQQGFPVTVFVPYDYGVETSANALFTTQSYYEEHPEVVCAMERAIARGWEYALANQEEAADIVIASDPDNLDREKELLSLAAIEDDVLTPDAVANGIGSMTSQRWQNTVDVLAEYGGLETEIDLASVYTDACFMP
jgi:ABC-type nitrate/sulfonate/bicarbonate transport system substrate-binding protein